MRRIKYKTNQNNLQIKAYKEAVEKGKKNHHVFYKDDAWVVIRAGTQKAIDMFKTQIEAVSKAESIARNQGTAVYVHGIDGRIRSVQDFQQ